MLHIEFLAELKRKLEPLYATAVVGGVCHDTDHVRRVMAFGPKIARATGLRFDLEEFEAAVWLHNLDKIPSVLHALKVTSLRVLLASLLGGSDFSRDAQERIVDAALRHSKKDDEPGDSALLTALRIADKLDSLGPIGIARSVSGRMTLPLYDRQNPFGFGSTSDERMKTVYDDFFRIIEWVGMLPSDAARGLIDKQDFRANVDFLRAFGRELGARLGVDNRVEQDIKRALGPYYQSYAC